MPTGTKIRLFIKRVIVTDWCNEWFEMLEVRKFLYQLAIKRYTHYNIEWCNFSCWFVYVCNFLSYIERATQAAVLENAVLSKIFGPKMQRETGEWRRLPHIIRVIKSRGIIREEHGARMGKRKHAYRVLVGKTEGKRPLGRTRRRRENNIKMDNQEVGWGYGRINLAHDRDKWLVLVDAVKNLRFP